HNVETLALVVDEQRTEVRIHLACRRQVRTGIEAIGLDATADLADRNDSRRECATDSRLRSQLCDGCTEHAAKIAERSKEAARHDECAACAGVAGSENHGERLAVAEHAGAELEKALARPFGLGPCSRGIFVSAQRFECRRGGWIL